MRNKGILEGKLPNQASAHRSFNVFKTSQNQFIILSFSILLLTILFIAPYSVTADDSPGTLNGGGILYSDKWGYGLSAPKGWMFDNQSGLEEELYCVMYPAGYTWKNTPIYIYAEIFDAKGMDLEQYIDYDIKDIQTRARVQYKKVKKFMSSKSYPGMIVDFSMIGKNHFERIAYVHSGGALCMIVMSTSNPKLMTKYGNAVYEVASKLFLMSIDDKDGLLTGKK